MKVILFVILVTCVSAQAKQTDEFLEFGLDRKTSRLKEKKTNFHVKFGASHIVYDNAHSFTGATEEFSEQEEKMGGADITLGYQISLYGPLSLTINTSWFHFIKNDNDEDSAESGDVSETISEFKKSFKLYGGGFGASLNYEFLWTGFVWQPFFEMGGGRGRANFTLDYERFLTNETESYEATIRDSFTYAHTGVGINVIAKNGLFSYLKVSAYQFSGIKRSYRGTKKDNDGAAVTAIDKNGTSETVSSISNSVVSLGMGYTF